MTPLHGSCPARGCRDRPALVRPSGRAPAPAASVCRAGACRPRVPSAPYALLAVLVTATPAAVAQVQMTTPDAVDFDQRRLMDGLNGPTAAAVAPDGRVFAIEKTGRLLWAPPGDPRPRRLLDLTRQVNDFSDRGLLGIALDSQFDEPESPYAGRLYLLYVHDPHGDDPERADMSGPTTSRLTYVTVDQNATLLPDGAGNVEHVVLDGIPAEEHWHQIGTVRADPDGTLWVGTGDATTVPDERALEALDPQRMRGKIFHIDRKGNGLPGHPFCPGEPDLTEPCTKVFAAGFRNPYRFQLRGDGGLVVGDVGRRPARGALDGGCRRTPRLAVLRGPRSEPPRHLQPAHDLPPLVRHARPAAQMADVFLSTHERRCSSDRRTPVQRRRLPRTLSGFGVLRRLRPRLDQVPEAGRSVDQFATDWRGVQLDADAAGDDLISVMFGGGSLATGSVWRITSSPGDHAPVARAAATRVSGVPPIDVDLSAAGSSDVDPGDVLTYHWDLDDDGDSDLEGATVAHRFEEAGRYTPRLVVRDAQGNVASDRALVMVGNPPKLELSGDETFRPGEPVAVDARAFDIEDGEMEPHQFTWRVRLQHNTHFHEYTSDAAAVRFTAEACGTATTRSTRVVSPPLTPRTYRREGSGGSPTGKTSRLVPGDPMTLGGAVTPRGNSAGPGPRPHGARARCARQRPPAQRQRARPLQADPGPCLARRPLLGWPSAEAARVCQKHLAHALPGRAALEMGGSPQPAAGHLPGACPGDRRGRQPPGRARHAHPPINVLIAWLRWRSAPLHEVLRERGGNGTPALEDSPHAPRSAGAGP